MRVAVVGSTGVIGRCAVPALVEAGHEVVAVARDLTRADWMGDLGVKLVQADLFEPNDLAAAFAGADAVCNFATKVPVGYLAALGRSWRYNDKIRLEGSRLVASAARAAGVRRLLQESISVLYADGGDQILGEDAPLDITPATEPAAVAESQAEEFGDGPRAAVVLRFGQIIGDDPLTHWRLRSAGQGRPVGTGDPDGWIHLLHTDDIGSAVVASLTVPGGVYNVGSPPVRRRDLARGFAEATGRASVEFMGSLLTRLGGDRLEPLTRSHRVTSERLTTTAAWAPSRDTFDVSWLSGLSRIP
jgi:nucleoside-diphosphate-sugar epimerase